MPKVIKSAQPWRIQVQLRAADQKQEEKQLQNETMHPGNFVRVTKFCNPYEISQGCELFKHPFDFLTFLLQFFVLPELSLT